jgi:hypothetical protein
MRTKGYLLGLAVLAAVACSRETVFPDHEPEIYTIRAGFVSEAPGTRSRLDFHETSAKVLWTAGDAFKMVRMNESNYSSITFTTQDDGVEQAVFTSNKTLSGTEFTSGYPADVYHVGRFGERGCILITPVPSEQQAVPGGIAEGLNRAAAYSTSTDADLLFHNVLSVIRFRVDGACVSTLASVTFDAGTTVAGDASVYFVEGEPVIDFSRNWSNPMVPRSGSVTLTGPFTAGQDYCMVLVPADLPAGFNMLFRDSEGHTLYKHSSKALTLGRSRIVDFGTIHLGDSWESESPEVKEEVIEYVHQKKGSLKNVIAVLAEGFTAGELDKFEALAKSAVDYLFSVEPYKSYKDYFTVYLCRAVSNESGAGVTDGNDTVITQVDNAFGSRWGEDSYSDMEADAGKIQMYLRRHIPEIISGELASYDVPTALLINDERYGGICHIYASGWCYSQIPYQYGGGTMRWSFPKYQAVNILDDSEGYRETTDAERDEMGRHVGDWRNTFLHEFGGHGFGRLTDEYWKTSYKQPGAISGHSYVVPYALNVTGIYEEIPWQADLLDNLDTWVARNPDYGRIGIWHGAHSSLYFRWRSEKTSCMIDNRPYFSTWQRILIVRRILEKVGETFDMDGFIAKDDTFDPVRPAADASAADRAKARSRALMIPEMPMLPPPVLHEEE